MSRPRRCSPAPEEGTRQSSFYRRPKRGHTSRDSRLLVIPSPERRLGGYAWCSCLFLYVARGFDPPVSKCRGRDPPVADVLRAECPTRGTWERRLTERDGQLLDVAGLAFGPWRILCCGGVRP